MADLRHRQKKIRTKPLSRLKNLLLPISTPPVKQADSVQKRKNEGAIGASTDNLGAEVPLIWMGILVYYCLSAPDAAGQCVTMSWLYSLA